MHPIIYIFLLGKRQEVINPLIPFDELVSPYLMTLGSMPQSLEHFALGLDYYTTQYCTGDHLGYIVLFVYEDNIEDLKIDYFKFYENEVVIFFLCTEENDCKKHIDQTLRRNHKTNYAYLCSQESGFMEGNENVFHNQDEVFKYLYENTPKYIDVSRVENTFSVHLSAKDADRGLHFLPTRTNTFTLHHIYGNWGFPYNTKSHDEEMELRGKAIDESSTFNRQQLILNQILQMASLELHTREMIKDKHSLWDQINAPLVITLPFTNADCRKQYEIHSKSEANVFQNISKTVRTVLSQGTTRNYTFNIERPEGSDENPIGYGAVVNMFFLPRSYFLDILGVLHCSFRFSPYLRLPFLGKDIDRQLSFVNPRINERLIKGRKRNSIEGVMMTVGKEMVERTLSDEMKKHLKEYPRQIVAITDLPIEWMDLDGVPLGFSHDVCRMPESPVVGNLMQYVINEMQHYYVPRDIIKHTLVVFGTREDGFKWFQDEAEKRSKTIGYKTRVCLTIDELENVVKEENPQFLIIDTHGGVDMNLHQTYLMIGKEKLYPEDITKRHITAPLVFLSACNTAPAYHTFNTVANAMIQIGGISVTSSYMPLWVSESSELYLRILHQLAVSADHPYHRNWLAFISHMLRTSYMHGAYKSYYRQSAKSMDEIATKAGTEISKSMFFGLRRKMFFQLKKGQMMDDIKIDTKNIVPHYLMYSTIGRADLVNFQCYMEEKFG